MNYYERHLGDYARDTAHLSLLEHGAYTLLLDRYYATEQPIPADQAHRVARARSRDERAAVDSVLGEFFTLTQGAFHNARADHEIAQARGRIEAARENGKRGGRPRKNPTLSAGFQSGSENKTQPKALQTPDTSSKDQSPSHSPTAMQAATTAGRACRLMRDAGCVRTNPSHAGLLQALAAGVTPEVLGDTAREGIESGKGDSFAWAIATAMNRHQDASRPTVSGPPRVVAQSRHVAGTAGFLGASHEAQHPDSDLVLDVDRGRPGELVSPEPRRLPRG